MFDSTIHLGDVITLFGFLLTLWIFHAKNVQRFQQMETKLDIIFKWFQNKIISGK